MNEEDKLRDQLFKVLTKLSKIANGLKLAAIPLLILNLVITIIGFYYFYTQTIVGHWRWGVPTLIMFVPLLSSAAIIWILDAVTSVPGAAESASGDFMKIVRHHRKKLDIVENKKISKFKYLRTVGKILWEATDVVDGVAMAAFVSTPLFWFIYLSTFIGSFILSGIMILTIFIHYLFA